MKFTKENKVYFCLCLFLGFAGAHKFYKGKKLLGFVYLFTGGLFLIGWAVDLISLICNIIRECNARKSLEVQTHSADVPPPDDEKEAVKDEPLVQFNVSITTKRVAHEPVGELSHLDFGKPAGVLGCYLNYTPRELCEPTERQLNYLHDLGVFVPDGITKADASCMISRATGEDSKEGPTVEIVALAFALGVEFSAFIGASGLFSSIIYQADDRQRAALFAYSVKQNSKGRKFGNMVEDPDVDLFYAFSDLVIADAALLRSLKGRDVYDYKRPHHGTAIYKAAFDFLTSKGVI